MFMCLQIFAQLQIHQIIQTHSVFLLYGSNCVYFYHFI